jgi:hypothetical protein
MDKTGWWAYDEDGNEAFGLSLEDTRAWAGFTIDKGDIVLGDNIAGSAAILWDQSAGTFGFYGSAASDPQIEITTAGKLSAGGGDVILDDSGIWLKALDDYTGYNSDGAVYMMNSTGATQWGRLYAYRENVGNYNIMLESRSNSSSTGLYPGIWIFAEDLDTTNGIATIRLQAKANTGPIFDLTADRDADNYYANLNVGLTIGNLTSIMDTGDLYVTSQIGIRNAPATYPLEVWSADQTDYIAFHHDGSNALIYTDDGGFHLFSADGRLRVYDNADTDYIAMTHDGTNGYITATGSGVNIIMKTNVAANNFLFEVQGYDSSYRGHIVATGTLKCQVFDQASEPTLNVDERFAFWKDSDDSDRLYLIFRRASGDHVKVELT